METNLGSTAFSIMVSGLIATALLDGWALLLRYSAGIQPTNWAMVGRWVGHMREGQFRHQSIGSTAAVRHELALGWGTHYVIGVIYAALWIGLCQLLNLPLSPAGGILFGLLTVAAPWLILQPGLGLGPFAINAPRPGQTRLLNLAAHSVFGLGLYPGISLARSLLA